eukprot:5146688-Prymnesium_polylepis.1
MVWSVRALVSQSPATALSRKRARVHPWLNAGRLAMHIFVWPGVWFHATYSQKHIHTCCAAVERSPLSVWRNGTSVQ